MNLAGGWIAGDVDGSEVVGGAAGGLEESGDEFAGGGDGEELWPGEELEEDVVSEEVGKGVGIGGKDGVGGADERVGKGEEGDRGTGREISGEGGGGEEAGEVG
ncbi:unnamed protein product [Rhodiola kirilowii]